MLSINLLNALKSLSSYLRNHSYKLSFLSDYNIEVESYEFDEKVPYAWSQETDKYKNFYGKIREEVERENLLKKFESEGESK